MNAKILDVQELELKDGKLYKYTLICDGVVFQAFAKDHYSVNSIVSLTLKAQVSPNGKTMEAKAAIKGLVK